MTWAQGEAIVQGLQIDRETILYGGLDLVNISLSSNLILLQASAHPLF